MNIDDLVLDDILRRHIGVDILSKLDGLTHGAMKYLIASKKIGGACDNSRGVTYKEYERISKGIVSRKDYLEMRAEWREFVREYYVVQEGEFVAFEMVENGIDRVVIEGAERYKYYIFSEEMVEGLRKRGYRGGRIWSRFR